MEKGFTVHGRHRVMKEVILIILMFVLIYLIADGLENL